MNGVALTSVIVSGIVAVVSGLSGYWATVRGPRVQAEVERERWLRERRAETFLALIEARAEVARDTNDATWERLRTDAFRAALWAQPKNREAILAQRDRYDDPTELIALLGADLVQEVKVGGWKPRSRRG